MCEFLREIYSINSWPNTNTGKFETVEKLAKMSQDDLGSEYKQAKESYAKNRIAFVTVLLAVLMKLVMHSKIELPIQKD